MHLFGHALLPIVLSMNALGAAPPTDADVPGLIRDLGSEEFEVREAATQRLLKKPGAEAALRRASMSGNLELARRAKRILASLVSRRLTAYGERLQADARAGAAGVLAERLIKWDGPADDPRCWQPALSFFHQILDRHSAVTGYPAFCPKRDFFQHVKKTQPRFLASESELEIPDKARVGWIPHGVYVLARGVGVNCEATSAISVIVSTGSAKLGYTPQLDVTQMLGGSSGSFVLSGGHVRLRSGGNVVIVCEGDLTLDGGLANSIVLVRGNVWVPRNGLVNCLIIAGGDVRLDKHTNVEKCTIRAGGKIDLSKALSRRGTEASEEVEVNFDPVRFFETKRIGLVTTQDKRGVRVSSVDADRGFARAGVRKGDLIAECDGKAVKTPEDLRRLLRRRVALEGAAELAVRRDGKALSFRVPLD
jgi:hypothetical protein